MPYGALESVYRGKATGTVIHTFCRNRNFLTMRFFLGFLLVSWRPPAALYFYVFLIQPFQFSLWTRAATYIGWPI